MQIKAVRQNMEYIMICFDRDGIRFNYRIAAVAIHNNKLLLHRYEDCDFWALPGGRAELQENSMDTIIREMKEELNEDITVDRLLWVTENFFPHEGKNFHEICFYYLIEFSKDSMILELDGEFMGVEPDVKLTFRWFELNELGDMEIYPEFVRDKCSSLNQHIEHIISCSES